MMALSQHTYINKDPVMLKQVEDAFEAIKGLHSTEPLLLFWLSNKQTKLMRSAVSEQLRFGLDDIGMTDRRAKMHEELLEHMKNAAWELAVKKRSELKAQGCDEEHYKVVEKAIQDKTTEAAAVLAALGQDDPAELNVEIGNSASLVPDALLDAWKWV